LLSYQLLRNHAGILLAGDFTSLHWLHEVIHDVNERSPLVRDKEGMFLALAYDIRKAYERQRESLEPPEHFEEVGVRYGVRILWPVLLLQQRMLRSSLAHLDHTAKTQAIAYALEAVIEEAVLDDFQSQGKDIITAWKRINPAHPDVFDMLDSRSGLFCSWTKAERKRKFLQLLISFEPLYDSYYALRLQQGQKDLVSPGDLTLWANAEWPDPKW